MRGVSAARSIAIAVLRFAVDVGAPGKGGKPFQNALKALAGLLVGLLRRHGLTLTVRPLGALSAAAYGSVNLPIRLWQ